MLVILSKFKVLVVRGINECLSSLIYLCIFFLLKSGKCLYFFREKDILCKNKTIKGLLFFAISIIFIHATEHYTFCKKFPQLICYHLFWLTKNNNNNLYKNKHTKNKSIYITCKKFL